MEKLDGRIISIYNKNESRQNSSRQNEHDHRRQIMKVLMLNGSPKANGNTYTALLEVGKQLEKEGIDYEIGRAHV